MLPSPLPNAPMPHGESHPLDVHLGLKQLTSGKASRLCNRAWHISQDGICRLEMVANWVKLSPGFDSPSLPQFVANK